MVKHIQNLEQENHHHRERAIGMDAFTAESQSRSMLNTFAYIAMSVRGCDFFFLDIFITAEGLVC